MKKLLFVSLALMLTGCGTTSNLKNAKEPSAQISLIHYNSVVVNDFKDGVTKEKSNTDILAEGVRFADMIADGLRAKKVFSSVERNKEYCDNAVLVDGEITEYKEGNAAARLLIGLGAGSSHFDATVNIKDCTTKEILGVVKVDKMSWALGGGIAASHDVNYHMKSSSKAIGDQLAKAKKDAQP